MSTTLKVIKSESSLPLTLRPEESKDDGVTLQENVEMAELIKHVRSLPALPASGTQPQPQKLGNPAVVGLGGFSLTTFVLQMHNLGYCGMGPVIALAVVFGGGAQLVAGFTEMATGNTFGFCAFAGYGAFWLSFALLVMLKSWKTFPISDGDIGWFLVAFTVFTAALWPCALRLNRCLAFTFTTLLIGFILLDIEKFSNPEVLPIAAWDLNLCAGGAFYAMAHAVVLDVFKKDYLPLGPPVW